MYKSRVIYAWNKIPSSWVCALILVRIVLEIRDLQAEETKREICLESKKMLEKYKQKVVTLFQA